MSKNSLQEYCQRSGLSLPRYTSSQQGPSHAPVWISTVEFTPREKSANMTFRSEGKTTKKKAEDDAAGKALNVVLSFAKGPEDEEPGEDTSEIYVNRKIALMVDVENLPKLIFQLPRFGGGLVIYAFVGKHHPLAETDYESQGAIKVISPSTRPDGTDTCMQTHVGALLYAGEYQEYLIATRDHFGSALVDLISVDTELWAGCKAMVVSTADHVLEAIRCYTQH